MYLRQRGHDCVLPNTKYDFNKRHFIARSLFYNVLSFMSLFHVYVYVLYELFFIDNVVRLLSCVKICVCHVHFTKTNLLTY